MRRSRSRTVDVGYAIVWEAPCTKLPPLVATRQAARRTPSIRSLRSRIALPQPIALGEATSRNSWLSRGLSCLTLRGPRRRRLLGGS